MEPIAIIGVGCRFPGAKTPEDFWKLLRNGVDAIREVPPERWDVDAFYDPDVTAPGKMNTRWAGLLDEVDQFDPYFFGISPREVTGMDPQQRLLLEVVWEALDDAGQVIEQLAGTSTGVFLGISSNDYSAQVRDPNMIDAYLGTGNLFSIAAGRISYLFNFRGPSLALDTACSSSLVAVHLACKSLLSGETTLALAGGVNLILSPSSTIALSKLSALSPDGRCKTFDAQANGYVRGEGAGMVVLKRLSQAVEDGDPIYAVIRGSAINHDGRSNGLTAPNGPSQEALIRHALADAGVAPSQLSYVEAHGTGTPLGDPIEVMALGAVLAEGRSPESVCAIGSIKTNIGHLEAAAGIASLIKVALALKHQEIPPSLHFQKPNPYIPFDKLPVRVQRNLGPWPNGSGPALAGISAFGFSGTNAHIILEAAPKLSTNQAQPKRRSASQVQLLTLSARSPEALKAVARSYRDFLVKKGPSATPLAEICYTASVRRTHHDYRLAVVFQNWMELIDQLEVYLRGESQTGLASGRKHPNRRPKLVFVFSGQGPQWWAMGRELLTNEPVFRAAIERIAELLHQAAEAHGTTFSLLNELMADEAHSRLDETEIAQPALFALQVALTELWRHWGIKPEAVVGHSMGEVAAAYVAGALSLPEAVRVIFHRGRLMQQATGQGKMAAIELSVGDTEQILDPYKDSLSIAAINGPTSTVISGETAALEKVVQSLQQKKIFARVLPVNYAFHSPQMEPFLAELETALGVLEFSQPALPIYSTVTGQKLNGAKLDAAYWSKNVRESIRFADAIEDLLTEGHDIFLEISPHPVLAGSISQSLDHHGLKGTVLPSLRRKEKEQVTLLETLGTLYSIGYPVDWHRLYPDGGQCVPLPPYPWQRARYWLQKSRTDYLLRQNGSEPGGFSSHPLLGRHLPTLAHLADSHFWEVSLEKKSLAYLNDHRLRGLMVLPATAYVEMALAGAAEALRKSPASAADGFALEQIMLLEALLLPENGPQTLQLILSPEADGQMTFQIFSLPTHTNSGAMPWTLHAKGKISFNQAEVDTEPSEPLSSESIADIQARCTQAVDAAAYYRRLQQQGLEYGPYFQGIEQLWFQEGEALGRIRLPQPTTSSSDMPEGDTQTHLLHPALLDACLQVLGASLPSSEQHIYIPTTMNQVRLYQPVPSQVWSHVRLTAGDYAEAKVLTGDVRLLDESGQVIAEILGIGLQRFGLAAQKTIQQHQNGSSITSEAGAASAAVQGSSEAVVQDNNSELINQVLLTEDPTARLHFLETYLKQRVAKVMKIPVSRLDIDKPLEALGFDSLMAVELKYRVESELAIEVPVRNLVEKPTVAQLASQLLNLMT